MNSDFLDAHRRHWDDAEFLFNTSRWANADHLYGVVAECGLKRLMMAFGMKLGPEGTPEDRDNRAHVMEARKRTNAWERYETYRSGHHEGASYGLPAANPFQDWDVSQRYAHRHHFGELCVAPHRRGASLVHGLIKNAEKAGLL